MARFLIATVIAGTLDILAAISLTLFYGRHVPDMLRYVASGPFPPAVQWGAAGAALGVTVHFALMAIIVATYLWAAARWTSLSSWPIRSGVAYGFITYVLMNLIVVPLRFGTVPNARSIVTQLFCHIVLVGIPIALVEARARRAAG